MDELFIALENDNEELVNRLATELLVDELGKKRENMIKEFKARNGFASIFPAEIDSNGYILGWIRYRGKIFYYGDWKKNA